MNELGKPTLIKLKNYLKLKNYSDRTIECYSGCILTFLKYQTKSAEHLSSDDFKIFIETFNFTSYQQQNQYISM